MKKRLFIFLAMAISTIALGFSSRLASPSSISAQEQGDGRLDALRETHFRDTLVLDVFTDAATFAANGGQGIEALMGAKRGDGFIVKGKIYRGGTIKPSLDKPSDFDPNSAPSIGAWICRGTFEIGFDQIMAGETPHVFSTQFHLLDHVGGLVTDGPEGGPQVRALIGGTGAFTGAVAEVFEESLGVNSTGLFNLRFTFKFKKRFGR